MKADLKEDITPNPQFYNQQIKIIGNKGYLLWAKRK
jgi:hypothetical protein